jgi:hypothetical protein
MSDAFGVPIPRSGINVGSHGREPMEAEKVPRFLSDPEGVEQMKGAANRFWLRPCRAVFSSFSSVVALRRRDWRGGVVRQPTDRASRLEISDFKELRLQTPQQAIIA